MIGKPFFTEDEWNSVVPRVVKEMVEYLRSYRVAISESKRDDDGQSYGEGWGSGSFLRLGDRVYILTNQHVARARREGRTLTYQFHGEQDIRVVIGDHAELPLPLDVAVLPVDMDAWANTGNKSKAIEVEQIALAHDPAKTELLTFTGFSGDRTSFHFGTLFSQGTCYTARECDVPTDEIFSQRVHFGIDYRPDIASTVIGDVGLPLPPGLSGSAVWDTGFVAARLQGLDWTPEFARLTGLVWGWPSGHACLVATRAEFVRSFLLGARDVTSV